MLCLFLLQIDQLRQGRVMALPAVQRHPFSIHQGALMACRRPGHVLVRVCGAGDLGGDGERSAAGVLLVVLLVALSLQLG